MNPGLYGLFFEDDEDGLDAVEIEARGDGEVVAEELGVSAGDGGDFADDHVADFGGPVLVGELHEVAGLGFGERVADGDGFAAEFSVADAFDDAGFGGEDDGAFGESADEFGLGFHARVGEEADGGGSGEDGIDDAEDGRLGDDAGGGLFCVGIDDGGGGAGGDDHTAVDAVGVAFVEGEDAGAGAGLIAGDAGGEEFVGPEALWGE